MAVTIERPRPTLHHHERRVNRHFVARDGTDVPRMARDMARFSRLAPSRATQFSEIWLGALAATLLIWMGEWVFLLYGVHFTGFNALYGALGGIVAFLLWIHFSSCVCVFGICFCAALAEVRAKADGPV